MQAYAVPPKIEGTGRRPRVLVVEFDEPELVTLCRMLRTFGFDVTGVDSSMSGLALLSQLHATDHQAQNFSGVMVELNMPVLGGLAFLQEMRERHADIPVMMMAEARHIDKLREAVHKGAREYLVKPFEPELVQIKCAQAFLAQTPRR